MSFNRFLSEDGISSSVAKQRLLQRAREVVDIAFDAIDLQAVDIKLLALVSTHIPRLMELEKFLDGGEDEDGLLDKVYQDTFEAGEE